MLPSPKFPVSLAVGMWVLTAAIPVGAQFNTPTINGVPNNPVGEYGSTNVGENYGTTESGPIWYMTWDADYLYVGIASANLWEGAVICIDANPIVPVNGGTGAEGSLTTPVYDAASFSPLPFRADFFTYFKSGYHDFRRADGNGGWTGQTANSFSYAENNGQSSREMAIPWNDVTGGLARPQSFNWFGYLTSESGFLYASIPITRLNGQRFTNERDPWYLKVDSTLDGSSTYPFAQPSYTYVDTGDAFLTNPSLEYGVFTDLTFGKSNVFLERDSGTVLQSVRDLIITAGEFRLGTSNLTLQVTRDVHLRGGQLTLGSQNGGDLRVGRDMRITPGAVFQGNDRQVELVGVQNSVIEGDFTGTNHIDYLRVNKTVPGSVAMSGDVEVNARLWLSNGVLDTNGNLLRIIYSGADTPNNGVLREGTDTGYVRGTLHRRIGLTQGIRQFPVGTNPAAPLFIDFGQFGPSQIGAIAVSTTEQTVAPLDADNMIVRAWQVDVTQPLGTYEAALTFQYDASDIEGAIVESNLRAAKQTGPTSFHAHTSTWLDLPPRVSTDGYPLHEATNSHTLDGLWLLTTAPDSMLRVDLVALGATCEGVGSPVTIEWETAAEFLNAGFNVYRIANDDTLRRINAFPIPAKGTETSGAVYAFVDPDVMTHGEVRAYVLEDIEFSGTRTRHGPVTVGPLEAASSGVMDWALFDR